MAQISSKNRTRTFFASVLGLLLVINVFTARTWARAEDASKKKTLKVGLVLGLTGVAATHANAIRKGVDLAAEKLKSEGWELDLNYQDDQGNPSKTVTAIQYLLSRDYRLFIGPTWSFQVSAAQKVLSQPDVVAMVPGGSSDINGGPGPGIFSLCPVRTSELPVVVEWLKRSPYKKAFILTPLGDWGEVHRDVYLKAIGSAGLENVGDERFNYGVDLPTLHSLLQKARAHGADVVLTTGSASDDANLLKARDELHYKAAILTSDTLRDIVHLNLLPKGDARLDEAFAIELPVSKKFLSIFRSRYGEAPLGFYSDRGYDALNVLAEATQATDGSGAAIRNFLSTKIDFEGVSGRIRFDKNGDVYDSGYVVTTGRDAELD